MFDKYRNLRRLRELTRSKEGVRAVTTNAIFAEAHAADNKLKIDVVSDEQAEEVEAVVCALEEDAPEQFKASNIHTVCADCGKAIIHRPHAPKKPKKICIACAVALADKKEEHGTTGDDRVDPGTIN